LAPGATGELGRRHNNAEALFLEGRARPKSFAALPLAMADRHRHQRNGEPLVMRRRLDGRPYLQGNNHGFRRTKRASRRARGYALLKGQTARCTSAPRQPASSIRKTRALAFATTKAITSKSVPNCASTATV